MMRRLIILSSILLLNASLYAQAYESESTKLPSEAYSKSKLELKAGIGTPTGVFGSDDLDDVESGLARVGLLLEANFIYDLKKSIYFTAMGRFQFNNVDETSLRSRIISGLGPNVSSSLEISAWRTNSILAGLGTKTTVGDGIDFQSRLMIGFGVVASPEIELILTDGISTITELTESVSSAAFAFLIGGGFNFNVSPKVDILIHLDYYRANPEFENVTTTVVGPGINSFYQDNFNQEIHIVNFSFGASLKI